MPCPLVRTLTLNPSIDASSDTSRVAPTVKLRMSNEQRDAGGGGINVARVLARLGVAVEAVYLAGGDNGEVLDRLLERMALPHASVAIAGDSRMSMTVHETGTGREYRFIPEGPEVSNPEVEAAIAAATDCASPWFVASGSIPRGVGDDVYARLRGRLGPDIRLVLDTSGPALARSIAVGGLYLVKASGDEFAAAMETSFADHGAVAGAARALVDGGKAELVAVSFGAGGALLASQLGAWFVPAPKVAAVSTVGAGDSFLAGIVYALSEGMDPAEALRWGSAAGGATAMSVGTGLCSAAAIRALLDKVEAPIALDA
ncbi:MAG: 1-phosphofructokinase family hexose kinase [Sphingomicrobium sp.]